MDGLMAGQCACIRSVLVIGTRGYSKKVHCEDAKRRTKECRGAEEKLFSSRRMWRGNVFGKVENGTHRDLFVVWADTETR